MGDLYNNMDKHIREKMQSTEFQVGPNQWANMDQLLDKQAAAGAGSSTWPITAWIAGGSIAAALTGWLLWQGLQQSEQPRAEPMATATEQVEAPQQQKQAEETGRLDELLAPSELEEAEAAGEASEDLKAEQPQQEQPMANAAAGSDYQGRDFALQNGNPTPPIETGVATQHQSNEGRYLSSQVHPFTENAPEGPRPKPESREVAPQKKPQATKLLLANNELPSVEMEALERAELKSVPVQHTACNFGYGFKGGLSASYRPSGSQVAPLAGAFLTYSLGAKFSLQAEANYRRMGYPGAGSNAYEQSGVAATVHSPTALHLVELPLLVRYKVLPLHHLNAGVRTSLVAHAESTNAASNNFKEMGGQAVDLSVLLGYEFTLSEHLSMELRYNLGLTNLQANALAQQEAFYTENVNATNQSNPLSALESDEQLIIPTVASGDTFEGLLVNRQLRNSDLQLSMYYRF